jgi:cyanophycinase-like exopeptidase
VQISGQRTRLARLALGLMVASLLGASAALGQGGTITYVARESLNDLGLRTQLEQIGGSQARRFVLALGNEASLPGVDRVLAPRSRAGADDPELCAALEQAEVLVLRGGSFLEWYETVYAEGGRTRLAQGLSHFLNAHRPVIAYGGACAFLSGGVSVPTAELDEVERNPRRRDEVYTERVALRIGPRALLDGEDWKDGSPIRLLKALHRTRVDLGLFLVGEVALRYDRGAKTLEVLGSGSVLALDLSRAKRSRGRVDRARVHHWTRGDVWDFGFRRALPGPGKLELQRVGPRNADLQRTSPAGARAKDLRLWLARLATGELDELVQPLGDAEWTLRWDSASRRFGERNLESIQSVELGARWELP